ncbi:MAG: sulfide/dihydroorotate dehydrogenase-like FAD/NAD-binding protein [Ignavibacteriales bacterium]|nr:sulfide/dihydroorotate dehydrogenase-like FAD/NAD-binding protein [Ignavibacteriales bacterium]
MFMSVGFTTGKLAELNVGDEILDLAGPLGVPTEAKNFGTVVCVAGGYGAAPCYLIAKAYKEAGNKVYIVMGARRADLIFWQDKMKSVSDELFIATDDGTLGKKGLVTDILAELVQREKIDHVMTIGPVPMMKAVAELTRPLNIYTVASIGTYYGGWHRMCGACRVTVGGKVKFACIEGPDFDAHLIDFDEITLRTRIYRDQECNLIKQAD